MEFPYLNESNWMMYAMASYNNPTCKGTAEFLEDIARIKYIKRLLRRYKKTGELRTQLITNHFIILNNVFGTTGAARLLFFKVENELYPEIKTFMVYLDMIPKYIPETPINEIPLNQEIVSLLRKERST
jgi:hypothetical protein